MRIGVDVDGVRSWRAYSLTSLSSQASQTSARTIRISITVKAIPDGKVSQHLVRHATPGTMIMLDQAAGDFTLPRESPAKVLFLTAGSGITPVMGMLRNAVDDLEDVVVLHSAPSAPDVIFRAELRALAARGAIRLIERHTDTAGTVSPGDVTGLVPDWAQRQTWACGPTGLLDAAEKHWGAMGIADLLHTERFGTCATAKSPRRSPRNPSSSRPACRPLPAPATSTSRPCDIDPEGANHDRHNDQEPHHRRH